MEDQVSHLDELEGLNSDLEGFLSDLKGREESYASRIEQLEAGLEAAKARETELTLAVADVKAALSSETAKSASLSSERDALSGRLESLVRELEAAKAQTEAASARLASQESALSRALQEAKNSLIAEISKSADLSSERDSLAAKLESVSRMLDEEKARSAEKDLFINSSRSAIKDKDAESERIWRAMEELKGELAEERAAVKDREGRIGRLQKQQETLEQKLAQAARDAARSEEGFLLKIDLVKKELRAQADRTAELERSLAAAGARLDEALEDVAHKERLLAEARAAVAAKEELLKSAGQKIRELAAEAEAFRSGRGKGSEELAASLSERVEELEAELEKRGAESLDKYRRSQAALSDAQAALRKKEEENAALRARETSLLKDIEEAEGKWKLSEVQLHNQVARLRSAENEAEITAGRLKTLEAERDKFRAAAVKAEAAAAALAEQESKARDGEAASLMAALEEQASKYRELLRKYDDLVLVNEAAAAERAEAEAEAGSLRARLEAFEAGAAGSTEAERERSAKLFDKVRAAEAEIKRLGFQLEEERSARSAAEAEADGLKSRLETVEAGSAGAGKAERERSAKLFDKVREAEAEIKKLAFTLEEARSAEAAARSEAAGLAARLKTAEADAAGAAEAEKERYAKLSEKMHNADAMLKKKEFELEEARAALSGVEEECELLRRSRVALGQKYSAEIQAENELVRQAQARVVERDGVISRLVADEDRLNSEAEALRKEKEALVAMVRRKAAPANAEKLSEAERRLAEKESRLMDLRLELERTKAEKTELESRESQLREEMRAKPYRAMLREAEDKLLIKEKMLAELNSRMKKLSGDFDELKRRGRGYGAPGYTPDFEELVAGVAHQIANSISIIRSHAEFCAESPEADGAKESLSVIVRNIVALQKKIDTIMNFSRPVIPQRSPEKLEAVVSETIGALRAAGRLGKASAAVEAPGDLPSISVDRVRLAGAIEQLLLNAAEAMPGGGEIAVRISSSKGRQRIEIKDAGEGIERKNLGALFHPFFTTRPGKMGLGLTLARNVARAHGGTLELTGEPGRGARAVLELPES